MKPRPFQCKYCEKRFIREKMFLKHKCTEMIREEESKTLIGEMAWLYYSEWFNISKRFKPSQKTFLKSRLYSQFIKFAEFVKEVNIVKPLDYIKLMVKENIPPNMWRYPDVHTLYLNNLHHVLSPMAFVAISVDTLYKFADDHNIKISDIFDVITPNEIILYLQRCLLSPWLLLKSKKFNNFLQHKANNTERILIENIINYDFWYKKFSKHSKEGKEIKVIVSKLNL